RLFFFSSRRRHTRFSRDWSSDVCSSDLVRGFLEAIADGVPRSEEEAGEYLRIAIDETARLQRLADALLEASSIALGGVAFEPVHVPLEPAVGTVVDRVMPQAAARGESGEVAG